MAEKWTPVSPIPVSALATRPAAHLVRGKPLDVFDYFNEQGLVGHIYRFEGSDGGDRDMPLSYCLNAAGTAFEWRWMAFGKPRPLYGPFKLQWQKHPSDPVILTDDLASVDACHELLPMRSAAWLGGLAAIPKIDWALLHDQTVILWPSVDAVDSDEPNLRAMKQVATKLAKTGCIVKLIDTKGQAPGWNLAVAREAKWPAADLMAWITERATQIYSRTALVGRRGAAAAENSAAGFFEDPAAGAEQVDGIPYGFHLGDDALYYQAHDAEGRPRPPMRICGRLNVVALVRTTDGAGWGKLLEFKDFDGKDKRWTLPHEMLQGDGSEYRRELAHQGLGMSTKAAARGLLTQYLEASDPKMRARCTDRTGWHGRSYVLPHNTISCDDSEQIIYQSDGHIGNTFRQRGTLAEWRENLAELCIGNSRLVFSVSCAFAAMLLELVDGESGGFHFFGSSSEGKSTAMRVAASVFGGVDYLQQWRATSNGVEALAKQHSGALLCLDEMSQMDPAVAGETAYMIANGQGKARASRSGSLRAPAKWKLLFMSTGEHTLGDHMQAASKHVTAGQAVRMLDIPIDAEEGYGAYDELRGFESRDAFSKALNERVPKYFGTAALAFLQGIIANFSNVRAEVDLGRQAFMRDQLSVDAQQQDHRAAQRFALVAAAGELASKFGITGWPEGEAMNGVTKCFGAWLRARGGLGNQEKKERLRCVKLYLEQHGDSRFPLLTEATNERDGRVVNRAGYRRQHAAMFGGIEDCSDFLITAQVFRSDVCKGLDARLVARDLDAAGCLDRNGKEYSKPVRVPGIGLVRCYIVKSTIFELDI